MNQFKIGITEAGDAGLDLSWAEKLETVDGAVLVTKRISPSFYGKALEHKDKLIIHATFTGYGSTVLEPCVPPPYEEFDAIMQLVKGGFPKERIVIRVDPIIPTPKGTRTALSAIETFMDQDFSRYRISVIDMYPHVRKRFEQAGLSLPYGNGFAPSKSDLARVDEMVRIAKARWEARHTDTPLRIEACAEPGLKEPIACGCISAYDLALLGLCDVNEQLDSSGYQRKDCMCYPGKIELLRCRKQCPHNCLYCYWKSEDKKDGAV